jgi:type II secretory pathway pseudopilin PulG
MTLGRRGYSFVELLVVFSFLGILAGIALPRILSARRRAYGAQVLGAINTIRNGLVAYYTENNTWPASGDAGYTPGALAQYVGSTAFASAGYSLQYILVSSETPLGAMQDTPELAIYPTDAETCATIYDMLGGASNPNAFAFCGDPGGVIYVYLT